MDRVRHTIALTVVFFVNPPTFPVDMASVSGKFTAYAPARQYPMNRAQTLSGLIWRAIAAPTMDSAEFQTIQYVRLFSNHEQPAVERCTRTPCTT
jgi:hypothetical protein